MLLSNDNEQQVRSGLQEAISLFCKAGFKFDVELSIDGLLAVTLDQKEVFLFNIKEIIRPDDSAKRSISCTIESHSNDSSLAASTDCSDTSDFGSKLNSVVCEPDNISGIAESEVEGCLEQLATSAVNETESSSSTCKVLHKARRKQHSLKKVSCRVPAVSDTLPCCSSTLKANDTESIAEDLSMRDGERSTSSEVYGDVCKLEVENDSSSNNDQYLTGILRTDDELMQHIKQEPSSVTGDDTGLPFISSLSSIRQRLGFMSQYIGMSQVVAGLHAGFITPSRAYPWPDNVLSPPAPQAACSVSQAANQMTFPLASTSEPISGVAKRPKLSLNIPTVRSNGRVGGFKSSPFLSPERNVCANCGAGRTTVWRRTEDKQILCNACGCYFKLHKVHRPLSMVRQEIRSRCRRPKNLSYVGGSMKYIARDLEQCAPSDSVLNLKVSPAFSAELNNQP